MPTPEARERRDAETRKRVDELAESWNQAVERFARWQHRVTLLNMGGMAVTIGAVLVGFLLLQGSRWEQSRDACERQNLNTQATVLLLKEDFRVEADAILKAQARYPHVPPLAHKTEDGRIVLGPRASYDGPMTCSEAASERVRGPRL